jgi:hypothetical protein
VAIKYVIPVFDGGGDEIATLIIGLMNAVYGHLGFLVVVVIGGGESTKATRFCQIIFGVF